MQRNTPLDRDIQRLLKTAERAIQNALQICVGARRLPYVKVHVSRVDRDLRSVLGAIAHVRGLGPLVEEKKKEKEKPQEVKPPADGIFYEDMEDEDVS